MEIAAPIETARLAATRPDSTGPSQAETFLETLGEEQNRFLNVIGEARSQLGCNIGQLASLSAIHVRLTRQFFDAQRSILTRRAEVEAEVALIDGTSDSANGANSPGVWRAAQHVNDDSIARAIDEVFHARETDGAAAQRQLAALVEEWWCLETREGKALIDDAHARSAIRRHRAELEAAERLAAAPLASELRWSAADSPASSHVSPHMLAFLDAGDSTNIESFLTSLSSALESTSGTPVEDHIEVVTNQPIVRKEVLINLHQAPPDEAFRHFWDHEAKSAKSTHGLRWLPTRVLLPMIAATSGLALVMVWIG